MFKSISTRLSVLVFGRKDAEIAMLKEQLADVKSECSALMEQVSYLANEVDHERSIRKALISYYETEGVEIWEVNGYDNSEEGTHVHFSGFVVAATKSVAIHMVAGALPQGALRYVKAANVTEHLLRRALKPFTQYITLSSEGNVVPLH